MSSQRDSLSSDLGGDDYDTYIVYNRARSQFCITDDTQLSGKFVDRVLKFLRKQGFSVYSPGPGTSEIDELKKAVKKVKRTIIILSPEFLRQSWPSLRKICAFVREITPENTFCLALDVNPSNIPNDLDSVSIIHFSRNFDNDTASWSKLRNICESVGFHNQFRRQTIEHFTGSNEQDVKPSSATKTRSILDYKAKYIDLPVEKLFGSWCYTSLPRFASTSSLPASLDEEPCPSPQGGTAIHWEATAVMSGEGGVRQSQTLVDGQKKLEGKRLSKPEEKVIQCPVVDSLSGINKTCESRSVNRRSYGESESCDFDERKRKMNTVPVDILSGRHHYSRSRLNNIVTDNDNSDKRTIKTTPSTASTTTHVHTKKPQVDRPRRYESMYIRARRPFSSPSRTPFPFTKHSLELLTRRKDLASQESGGIQEQLRNRGFTRKTWEKPKEDNLDSLYGRESWFTEPRESSEWSQDERLLKDYSNSKITDRLNDGCIENETTMNPSPMSPLYNEQQSRYSSFTDRSIQESASRCPCQLPLEDIFLRQSYDTRDHRTADKEQSEISITDYNYGMQHAYSLHSQPGVGSTSLKSENLTSSPATLRSSAFETYSRHHPTNRSLRIKFSPIESSRKGERTSQFPLSSSPIDHMKIFPSENEHQLNDSSGSYLQDGVFKGDSGNQVAYKSSDLIITASPRIHSSVDFDDLDKSDMSKNLSFVHSCLEEHSRSLLDHSQKLHYILDRASKAIEARRRRTESLSDSLNLNSDSLRLADFDDDTYLYLPPLRVNNNDCLAESKEECAQSQSQAIQKGVSELRKLSAKSFLESRLDREERSADQKGYEDYVESKYVFQPLSKDKFFSSFGQSTVKPPDLDFPRTCQILYEIKTEPENKDKSCNYPDDHTQSYSDFYPTSGNRAVKCDQSSTEKDSSGVYLSSNAQKDSQYSAPSPHNLEPSTSGKTLSNVDYVDTNILNGKGSDTQTRIDEHVHVSKCVGDAQTNEKQENLQAMSDDKRPTCTSGKSVLSAHTASLVTTTEHASDKQYRTSNELTDDSGVFDKTMESTKTFTNVAVKTSSSTSINSDFPQGLLTSMMSQVVEKPDGHSALFKTFSRHANLRAHKEYTDDGNKRSRNDTATVTNFSRSPSAIAVTHTVPQHNRRTYRRENNYTDEDTREENPYSHLRRTDDKPKYDFDDVLSALSDTETVTVPLDSIHYPGTELSYAEIKPFISPSTDTTEIYSDSLTEHGSSAGNIIYLSDTGKRQVLEDFDRELIDVDTEQTDGGGNLVCVKILDKCFKSKPEIQHDNSANLLFHPERELSPGMCHKTETVTRSPVVFNETDGGTDNLNVSERAGHQSISGNASQETKCDMVTDDCSAHKQEEEISHNQSAIVSVDRLLPRELLLHRIFLPPVRQNYLDYFRFFGRRPLYSNPVETQVIRGNTSLLALAYFHVSQDLSREGTSDQETHQRHPGILWQRASSEPCLLTSVGEEERAEQNTSLVPAQNRRQLHRRTMSNPEDFGLGSLVIRRQSFGRPQSTLNALYRVMCHVLTRPDQIYM